LVGAQLRIRKQLEPNAPAPPLAAVTLQLAKERSCSLPVPISKWAKENRLGTQWFLTVSFPDGLGNSAGSLTFETLKKRLKIIVRDQDGNNVFWCFQPWTGHVHPDGNTLACFDLYPPDKLYHLDCQVEPTNDWPPSISLGLVDQASSLGNGLWRSYLEEFDRFLTWTITGLLIVCCLLLGRHAARAALTAWKKRVLKTEGY
jgi:hypothetical protein